jgi:hypothetical protein
MTRNSKLLGGDFILAHATDAFPAAAEVAEDVRAHPPTDPVGQQIDLLAIGPAYTTCNTVCI